MANTSLDKLTPAELKELEARFEAKKAEEEKKKKEERQAYKDLVDEVVPTLFAELVAASERLSELKKKTFDGLQNLVVMKNDVFGNSDDQFSHSFTTRGGITIQIGQRYNDNYDDTVTAGISKVERYLKSLGRDENSENLIDTIMKLLSKDKKGNLKPSRVTQLKQLADKTGDKEFMDGIEIIQQAYNPVKTKEFVTVRFKDNNGDPKDLPLDMTSADFEFRLDSKAAETAISKANEKKEVESTPNS